MKKIKTLLLAGILLGMQGANMVPVQAQGFSHHLIDELLIDKLPVAMYYESGRTMVELEDVAKATDTTVSYNYPWITIDAEIVKINLEIGSKNYYVNEKLMTLPVAPTLKDAHVFLPLFDIVKVLGLDWHQDNDGIQISGKMIETFSTIDVYKDQINNNGVTKALVSSPFYNTDKSETMIDLRDFEVATGTEIDYKYPWITITDSDKIVDLTVGDKLCKVNQQDVYKLSTTPTIKNDTVYLPIKEVSEILGFSIDVKDDLIFLAK
ncbi:hypothetical protein AN639_05745 [Candidatus Epulonipiscium fishelsonii]|uniref:Uncharacterized protein n=1 Tax=Candidatus Epulonipiscium fishelsonii TaxID=77094 RepID=A0ACC8XGZ3_9FIRM|nr:hypothetical protein AN639_05745 [Epulopiscium sp. SCG-B05WGA-EpuloA1]ONI42896.1 hypothetical protein AN396_12965 [Epulopiscium sp. SCG-B11WGA-EpuloA1]